ncbi:MAG: MFS transporter [SAR86 cluster bacterium]|nr:MFS transporter [SAR86 cluster bacterium]
MNKSQIFSFGIPAIGAGYMYLLLSLYVMKFSTDVLLIAPAIMGLIFSISRIWDAISDPLVGYLSDRTKNKFGRRRSWILASCIPISIGFYAVFSPPENFQGQYLIFWMALSILTFYSAMTLFFVPHMALGAELSNDYHERSKLFGIRHICYTIGSSISLGTIYLLINEELSLNGDVRQLAKDQAIFAVLIMTILISLSVFKLREKTEFQGRVKANPLKAFRDVWLNPHAKLLIIVTFIENIGSAAIATLTLYISQYVVGAPAWAPIIILAYMIPSILSVPLWLPLSTYFGKIKVWVSSMMLTAASFGGMFFLPFISSMEERLTLIIILAFFAGLASGCGGTIGPSVQGDVIDYDEYTTYERKEGTYFAAWNFIFKSAYGVMLLMTGFVLQIAGFIPNQDQTMEVKISMVSLYGLLPLICYTIGAILFSRFKLDEKAYSVIRKDLDMRVSKK